VIPQRVKLKGFLCYKEEQEVSFDGNATLWMLSGLNGSGKSSVFDAVTYALFGHHRGGGQQVVELINKDSDSLLVEFDFQLDRQFYRAKRTYRRNTRGGGSGTQQMFRYETRAEEGGSWVPVEGTGQKREFDGWVAENIGLTYDTFTSSVLLLQGKAEKLLDSKPEGRREVLASIVDLERYERLHARADEQRKTLEGQIKGLGNRLAALPAVSPEQVAEADAVIALAQETRDRARDEVTRLTGLEHQARAWVELRNRLEAARQRWEQAQRLLGDSSAIERDVGRLRELRDVLPRLNEAVGLRTQVRAAMEEARRLGKEKGRLAEHLADREHALRQARDKRASLQTLLARDEAEQREVSTRLRASIVLVEKLSEYDRQESDLAGVRRDLGELGADPAEGVAQARAAYEGLAALAAVVPALARFQSRRDELRAALAREQAAGQDLQEVEARGKERAGEVERLKPLAEIAGKAQQQASDQATEAKTLLQQARQSLQEVTHLDGAKVCRHCGQRLTEGHVQEEKRRRGAEVKKAEDTARAAADAHKKAQAEDRRLREALAAAERAHQDARLEYRDAQNRGKQARIDVERLQVECAQAHADLPEAYRVRVGPTPAADWTATTYPTPPEVAAMRVEAAGLAAAQQRLAAAEEVQRRWGGLEAKESAILAALGRLRAELPGDRAAVRREHADLEARERALDRSLQALRDDLKSVEGEIDVLAREREQAQAQLSRQDNAIKEQDLLEQQGRQGIGRVVKALPPAWQAEADGIGPARWNELDRERALLEENQTDERGRRLQEARVGLDTLRQDAEALERQREEFPAEARQEPEAVAAHLALARRSDRACEEELSNARQQRALLESYRKQREQIEQEYLTAEGELATQRLLAELLGRDRLQLFLVRQAERQVVEYANAVLDRLSGGQLYLKLSGEANGEGSAAKALELEAYNRGTGEKPINVAFLSGSQKFRVAVSLALGIGQYASRQHRPIESVIIDEGFGCLDSQGRQVMIQELQNLRGQMRCILLVSHQEEFADAFPDGYHFHLDGGATRVKRFQR
jgi:DNA repair exonuclease SbcCD ATPase subunit